MNFELNNTIKMLNKYSNVDALYGPYHSIGDACSAIPQGLRNQGLTVGIINRSGEVQEYWWNTEDVSDNQLKQKVEAVDLSIFTVGPTVINANNGDDIIFRFGISGRAAIQKGFVYQVVNNIEVFLSEFTNVGKSDDNSITITPPSAPGVYTYRIKVIDSTGAFAKTEDGFLYVEYELRYGSISMNYNLANLDRIIIKNVLSVAGQYFTGTIGVRDSSFDVTGVYLTDRSDVNILLPPYKSLTELNDTYIGYNFYILPSEEVLYALNGKLCYIKVVYTENGQTAELYKELFTLLDITSLEIVQQSAPKEYYTNFPDYYSFQLKSGISGVSIYVAQGENSDFTFEPVTITAYNSFSLRVVPKSQTQEAHLILNCSYVVGGVLQTKLFNIIIGSISNLPERLYYVPPTQGTVSLESIISTTQDDPVDGTTRYKIVSDATSDEHTTCAFLVDTYCKINQINDKSIKYIQIFLGDVEIGYVTEDVISCRGIITDTPLNEWILIGLGYNLEETVIRNNQSIAALYHAIYINGMVIKNSRIDTGASLPIIYDPTKPITIKLSNNIQVNKCQVYYNNAGQLYINPNANVYSIIYTNYLAHNSGFEEPENLPILKLMRITDEDERWAYFDLISQENEDLKYLTTFGTIGLPKAYKMDEYDSHYYDGSATIDHDNATLFRQSVDIKKPAQKEYATLCRGQYIVNGVNLLEGCIIEVHTQGTSTLVYPVPNFKFTFWKVVGNSIERFEPPFVESPSGGYYQESVYTAKADYMDSSHLNNTPTCVFYNNLILSLIGNENFLFDGSPSAANGGLDAIMGFPIVLEISDNATSMQDVFTNIGSFMLNVDKTGNSLGFEVDGKSCLSLEGTSNDNESGASGRFIIPDGLSLKEYRNQDGSLNELAIDADEGEIQNAITSSGKKLDLQTIIGQTTVENHPYVKWCKFLSEGLEYRYPDSDIYKTSVSGTTTYLTKILKKKDFKKIYKMWIWVNESDVNPNYVEEFTDHFDLDYCMLYFIQLMIFGQTDNLGKNAMFDTWDGEHWYPRPYDLDSQAGLDNNGNDNVATFVEIKPQFSLNYDPNYTQEELEQNYLLEDSLVPYGTRSYKRYHYSSNSSKLWINFYKNYKNTINSFYKQLRTVGGYTPDAIINLCETRLINKLGILQYNKDFNNKYLATVDQALAYGNRWTKFKKWIHQRFAFCDSYFGASDIANYNLISAINYNMVVASPQYVMQTYQEKSQIKFVTDNVSFSSGSAAATKLTLQANQNQILNTTLFKYVSYQSGPRNYTDIIALDVSGNKQLPSIESVVGTTLTNLKTLNVSNSGVTSLNYLPTSLTTLLAENISLVSVTIPQNSLLQEISLKGTTIGTNISFSMLPNLRRLDLSNCTISGDITLANLPALEEFIIDGAKFNGNIIIQNNVNIEEFDFFGLTVNGISFDGRDIKITKLNFHNTSFAQSTINMDAISNNVEEIYFNGCSGLHFVQLSLGIRFQKLNTFSIQSSPITSLGSIEGEFDASCLGDNVAGLKKVSFSSSGSITYSSFTFEDTKISTIRNLIWNGTGNRLFYGCTSLQHIYDGALNITTTLAYAFWRCSKLESLPTININENTTSATYTFAGANNLSYAEVSSVIKKCTNVTNFTGALFCKKFNENVTVGGVSYDVTINLNDLFLNNSVVENLTDFLCQTNHSMLIDAVTNRINVVGKIPSTVTTITYMFEVGSSNTIRRIPYDIIASASSLTTLTETFYRGQTTFYKPSGSSIDLPQYVDSGGSVIVCYDAVDQNFFPTNITSLSSTFMASNVQIIDTNVFRNLTKLNSCLACFANCHGGLFSRDISVDTMWSYCPAIRTISACFAGVRNAYCTSTLLFHENITEDATINISGLFGLSSWNSNSLDITINIDQIKPTLTTSNLYRTARGLGVFLNRKVHITSSESSVFSKLRGDCTNMFYGSILYLNSSVSVLNLGNVEQALDMFNECQIYLNQDPYLTRKFVQVLLPTSCVVYTRMFRNSIMLSQLPVLRSTGIQRTDYMFEGCTINSDNVQIPANYFQICKNSIQNTSYMFRNNIYITELEYDQSVGLFSDCVNLTNVNNMFYGATFLHKGVPNNIFGTTVLSKLVSLREMFSHTSVLYDIADESNKWINSNTFAPLLNLKDIYGMFSYMRIDQNYSIQPYGYREQALDNDGNAVYVIAGDSFAGLPLEDIRQLFYHTSTAQNIPFEFKSFEYGQYAFCDSCIKLIAVPFITEENSWYNIKNVSRMFAMRNDSDPKAVTNLGSFINKLKITSNPVMSNIAANLTNDDVDSELKSDVEIEMFWGHNLDSKPLYQ